MRFNKVSIIIVLLITAFSVQSTTLPAPVWHTMHLSDGSTRELRLMGSQDMFWYQDRDGNLYIQHSNKQWYFAKYQMETGAVISTGILVLGDSIIPAESNSNNNSIKPLHLEVSYHRPIGNKKQQKSLMRGEFPWMGVPKSEFTEQPLLVVQVSFSDEVIENDFQSIIFSENQQSVQDYFLKNSYGNYKVIPAIENQGTINDGVIDVTLDVVHPNCHSKSDNTCQSKLNNVFTKAYEELDSDFDLSLYDIDNDGSIEPQELSVMFIFAGNDKSSGTNKVPTIWPHKYGHNSVMIDGKRISAYCLFADYQHDHQSTMGVIAHELGHLMLGLPDLYSYKHHGSIGQWGLMGGGSWAKKPDDQYSGQTPVNMLAWSKEASGFIEPQILSGSGQIEVKTKKGESVIYLDPYLKQFGPRAYVENRRKTGYDEALRGEGLLVTAVNIDNQFNSSGPMQVQILQADGDGLLESGRSSGDSGDVFPGRDAVTLLSDTSTPSLTSVTNGRNTHITLSDINSDTQRASFSLLVPNSDRKSSWVTTFGRTYPSYHSNTNVLGFTIDVAKENMELVGVQFYAKSTTVALPMFYRLIAYPYQSRFGQALINEDEARLLSRGVAPQGGGQMVFDSPIELEQGTQLLVLEVENGTPEYSTQFLDAYLGDGRRKEQFFGHLSEYKTNGLRRGFSRNFPFAVLFEQPIKNVVTAIDDVIETSEDTAVRLNLKNNDTNIVDSNSQSIELGKRPIKGTIKDGFYYPSPNIFGQDDFTYRLVDREGNATEYANVRIDISPVNDPPIFVIDEKTVVSKAGQKVTFLISSITDVDSEWHQIRWSLSEGRPVILNGANTKTLRITVPIDAQNGEKYKMAVEVTDQQGAKVTQYVTVLVEQKKIKRLDTQTLSITDGDQVTITPRTGGTIHHLKVLESPKQGIVNVVGNHLVYRALSGDKNIQRSSIKYYVILDNGDELEGNIEIKILPKKTLKTTSKEDDSSGGSTSLIIVVILCLFGRLRKHIKSN